VTARSEEKEILLRVTNEKMKLLPKILASDVPIINIKEDKSIILVDNDDLVHINWKIQMKKQGINLASFYSISEFLDTAYSYSTDTPIFLDSNLDDGIKGEVDGIKIYNLGFNNIKITTGYNELDQPYWVRSIIGKCPQQAVLKI
jgi:hypothetical protein